MLRATRFYTFLHFYAVGLSLLFYLNTTAQTIAGTSNSNTWALVVGISDYQDLEDLQFADKDAEEFIKYLTSEAGGALDEELHIKKLINEEATYTNIYTGLDWLLEKCQEGDRAIIFFAGHGGVKSNLNPPPGLLLGHDTNKNNYLSGAVRLSELNFYLSTTSQKGEVILVVDACRAGKDNEAGLKGAQAVNYALSQPQGDITKIISCQANEFSHESEKWGGGRGIFSYHLLEGLYGLADADNDNQITLKEIGRYVEDNVPKWADPDQQNPTYLGTNKNLIISEVVPELLAAVETEGTSALPEFGSSNIRGFKETVLRSVDTVLRKTFREFEEALASESSLSSPSTETLYSELMAAPELEALHTSIKRDYVAALLNDVQQALKRYLKGDMIEMEYRFKSKTNTYEKYPGYLAQAIELLGPDHILHSALVAKQLYFEGILLRFQADQSGGDTDLMQLAMEKQQAALKYDSLASFVYNEIGVIYSRSNEWEKAYPYYKRAIQLSPDWSIPYTNLAAGKITQRSLEEKIQAVEQSIQLNPDYYMAYVIAGGLYESKGNYLKAEAAYRKAITKADWHYLALERLGKLLIKTARYEEANKHLQKAEYNKQFFLGHLEHEDTVDLNEELETPASITSSEYLYDDEYISSLLNKIKDDPGDTTSYLQLGEVYLFLDSLKSAEQMLKKALLYSDGFEKAHVKLAELLSNQSRYEEQEIHQKRLLELQPDKTSYWYALAKLYRESGQLFKEEQLYKHKDFPVAQWRKDDLLGRLYEEQGFYDQAETQYQPYKNEPLGTNQLFHFYDRQIERFPESPQYPYRNALLMQDILTKKLEDEDTIVEESVVERIYQAKEYFDKALEIKPDWFEASQERAVFMDTFLPYAFELRDVQQAYERALALDPDNSFVQTQLVETHDELLGFEQALYYLKQLQKNQRIDYIQRLQLGRYLAYGGQYDEAFAILDTAYNFQPKDENVIALLGFITFQQYLAGGSDESTPSDTKNKTSLDRALYYQQQILEWYPDNQDANYNLGLIALQEEQPKEAINWFKEAVENGFNYPLVFQYDTRLTDFRTTRDYRKIEKLLKK